MKLATVYALFSIFVNFYVTVNCGSSTARIHFVDRTDSRVPFNYRENYHYRSLFGIILEPDQQVRFSINRSEIDYTVSIRCDTLDAYDTSLRLTLTSNKHNLSEVDAKITLRCVPSLLVSTLHKYPLPTEDKYVFLQHYQHHPLPHYILSEEQMTKLRSDRTDESTVFLNSIKTLGFITTPRAQYLIAYSDARMLLDKPKDFLNEALVFVNDMLYMYHYYSGRSPYATHSTTLKNYDFAPDTIFYKYETCENTLAICRAMGGYYGTDRAVKIGNTIEPFLQGANSWSLLHESGHHYDIYTNGPHADVRNVWVNIYAAFYQSRYQLNHYSPNKQNDVTKMYLNRMRYNDMDDWARVQFLIALFSIGDDVSSFRAFNLEHMRNDKLSDNLFKNIAEFMAHRYNYNVYHYINNNLDSTWLSMYDRLMFISYPNILMPCFYYDPSHPYPYIRATQEHNLTALTQLYLCPQRRLRAKTILFRNPFDDDLTLFVNGVKHVVNSTVKYLQYRTYDDLVTYMGFTNKWYIPYNVLNLINRTKAVETVRFTATIDKEGINLKTINKVPITKIQILGLGDALIGEIVIDTEMRTLEYTCFISDGHPYFPDYYAEITVSNTDGEEQRLIIKGKEMDVTSWSTSISEGSIIHVKGKEVGRMRFFNTEKVTDVIGNQNAIEFILIITKEEVLVKHDDNNIKLYFVNKHKQHLSNFIKTDPLQRPQIFGLKSPDIVPITKISVFGNYDLHIGEIVVNTKIPSLDYSCFVNDGHPYFPDNYAEITVIDTDGKERSLVIKGKGMTNGSLAVREGSIIRIKGKEMATRMKFFVRIKITDVIGDENISEFQSLITKHGLVIEAHDHSVKYFDDHTKEGYLRREDEIVDLKTIQIVPMTKIRILGLSDALIGEIVINTENRSLDYTHFNIDGHPYFPDNYVEITVIDTNGTERSLVVKGKNMAITSWSVPITEDSGIHIKGKEVSRMRVFNDEKMTDVIADQFATEFRLIITRHGLLIKHDDDKIKRYFVNKHKAYLSNLNQKYSLQKYEILDKIANELLY